MNDLRTRAALVAYDPAEPAVGTIVTRAEIAEALAFHARRIETLELAGEPELQNVSGIYGVESLPVRFATV